jgi:hypothetical protein
VPSRSDSASEPGFEDFSDFLFSFTFHHLRERRIRSREAIRPPTTDRARTAEQAGAGARLAVTRSAPPHVKLSHRRCRNIKAAVLPHTTPWRRLHAGPHCRRHRSLTSHGSHCALCAAVGRCEPSDNGHEHRADESRGEKYQDSPRDVCKAKSLAAVMKARSRSA